MAPTWAVPGLFFFKTNELTDFMNFISWPTNTKLPLLHCHTTSLPLGIEVTAFLRSAKQKDMGSSPVLDQNFFLQIFFGFVRLFFRKYLQRVHPSFFCLFCKKWMFKVSQSAPFYMFRHYATYRKPKKFEKKFKKFGIFFSNFSSSGYCRREYLTLWSPFAIFEP